jgi:endonuclease/exonuclease/phosphatase family metal-dependent hydrolase
VHVSTVALNARTEVPEMRHAAVALAAFLTMVPAAHAQTVTLRSAKDATLRGGTYASTNFGDEPVLETRAADDLTYLRRAALSFDTDATVPANAHIASATLVLTVKDGNSETRRLAACTIPVSFDGWTVTWKVRRTGTPWQNPGGDVVDGSCSQASVTATANSKVKFDVTSQVQKVVNGTYGSRFARFMVGDIGSASKGSLKQYYANSNPTASLRPTLIVVLGTSTSPSPSPTPTTTTGTTLRVLHWNTHHGGVGTDGRYDPNRLATWIAKFNPDLISLNEIEYYTGYGNTNQPALFASLLKQKTGRTWYYKFCTANGETKGNGNLVMSRYPLDAKSGYQLSYDRCAAHITVHVNGRAINMTSTHLDENSTSERLTEIGQLKSWESGIAEQRIIAGDFNAWPQTTENVKMTTTYYDSWAQAVSRGIAVAYPGNEEGNTRHTRIDYIYYSHGATALVLKRVQVFDTRNSSGVMPSDHRPIMATFTVK